MSTTKPAAKKTRSAKTLRSTKTTAAAAKSKAAPSKAKKSTTVKATAKKTTVKKAAAKKSTSKTDLNDDLTIDRRLKETRRKKATAAKATETKSTGATPVTPVPTLERREKVTRRRQIDPTTCERDYNEAEVEFMNALDLYKRSSGRMFPTCSEVLEVVMGLGYAKLSATEMATRQANAPAEDLEASVEADANEALEESLEFGSEMEDSDLMETV